MRGQFEPDLSMGILESIPGAAPGFCVSSPALAHSTILQALMGCLSGVWGVSQPIAPCYHLGVITPAVCLVSNAGKHGGLSNMLHEVSSEHLSHAFKLYAAEDSALIELDGMSSNAQFGQGCAFTRL
jgi:hypothetical protein